MPGKVAGKLHEKTIQKIMIVIRLEMQNLGLTAPQIALHLGVSVQSYTRLTRLPLYQQLKSQYMTGVLAPLDNQIFQSYNYQRKILEQAVPTALENLLALASQKVDNKMRFEASKEILDRHGMHAKVSRTGIAMPEQGGAATHEDNEVANALLKNLTKAKKEKALNDAIAAQAAKATIEDEPASPSIN